MTKKTKSMIAIEERLAQLAPGSLRFQVLASALDFKHAWVELGQLLTQVRDAAVYKEWGFDDFERYCERELHIKKATAHKLTATYGFMERREPSLLAEARERPEARAKLPDFEVLRVLTEAEDKGQIGDQEYATFRGEVFEGSPPTAAKVQKMLKTRWPTPPPPEPPVHVRLKKLARAAAKLAEATESLAIVPPELKDRAGALAADLEALAAERAA
ncbi:MAG: hypothetical protein P1V51_19195 [Deltaproteobacteria bacterium]|nr:hypothetical protein [Deltaproteobacteria bacterium]